MVLLLCCENNDDLSLADRFMKSVEAESYDDMFLPDLRPSDISTLLNYRNNHKILSKFPANPISSYICDSVTVGTVALRTIESIRTSMEIKAHHEFDNFPSNPCLRDTSNKLISKFTVLDTVAILYYNWWVKSDIRDTDKLTIDPLTPTTFRWY